MYDCKCYLTLLIFLILGYVGYESISFFSPPPLPKINENGWWNFGKHPEEEDKSIKKFRINFPDEVILKLKWKLENHRSPIKILESANEYGTNLHLLEEIVDFWKNEYNWTERESYLNKFPQFKTNIQGLDIHFIHVKPQNCTSSNRTILPLLLVHGWPGSVREYYELIDILRNVVRKRFVLELIVPSLPGFGFSDAPVKSGLGIPQVAVILKQLMNRLGHKKFYVQGGDLGAITVQIMSVLYPDSIMGFHSNFPLVYTPTSYIKPLIGLLCPSYLVKSEHFDRVYPLISKGIFIFEESGYLHLQSTKPDSIGVAIDDSPVGLAAYFVEKFITGSNFSWRYDFNSKNLQEKFSYTDLIDNLMLYWLTQKVTTAFRIYYESFGKAIWSETFTLLRRPVKVPTIIFRSKYDLYMPDGVLSEIYPKLIRLSDYDTGHFPAFENPELFAKDLIEAMEAFEDYKFKEKYFKLYRNWPRN